MSSRSVNPHILAENSNKAANTTIATRGKGLGSIPIQPLVHATKSAPQTPLFLAFKNGSKRESLPHVLEAAVSVGLSQFIVTGIQSNTPTVVALCFKGSSNDGSLSSVLGVHNLDNIPRNSLFFYYDGSNAGILQAAFGGDPVEIWNRRTSHSFREISFELRDLATGENIAYNGDVYMWLYVHTEMWQ